MSGSERHDPHELARLRRKVGDLQAAIDSSNRTANTLRESEAKFRALVEATGDWLWEVSVDGVYTYASPQVTSILGYTPEYVVGKTPFDLMPPGEAERVSVLFRTHLEKGEPIIALEIVAVHRDGRHVVLETTGLPFFDETGRPKGYRGMDRDITARKRAEAELLEEKALADAMLDGVPGVFYVLDDTGRFMRWNRNLERVSGYSADEIQRMAPDEFFPVDERSTIEEAIAKVFIDGRAAVEASFMSKDRNTAPYLMTGARIEIGGKAYLAGMGMDISARKRAELEKLMLERQVQHAQKLESLGVLAGGIAHDFNNLLMGIMGNVDLALQDLPPEAPARESMREIERSATRLADLAKQMLAYSGKGRFRIQRIDLRTLIQEMVDLLEVSRSKKAIIRYNFAENVPPIEADATQIRQIVMNLVVNASEALGNETGTVLVRTGVMSCDPEDYEQICFGDDLTPGDYSFFEVSDTGAGMDEATIARVFDPFFSTKFAGRGLGLAAVMGIVRGHSGAVRVRSEPGRGTSFKVLFPAAPGAAHSSGKPKCRVSLARLRGKTVLLVDDEEVVRTVSRTMLERLGLVVITAESGEKALTLYRDKHEQIDLIILDLTMPQMDGEETFRELRGVDEDVRVLLSSGYNEQELTARLTAQGLAGFIQKPYQTTTLGAALLKALERA